MSVTDTNYAAGDTIKSGNVTDTNSAAVAVARVEGSGHRVPINSGNAGLNNMSTEELEAYERRLVMLLGGPVSEEERQRRRRRYEAAKTGEICGKCGRGLSSEAKVYRTKLKWMTVLCEECAPNYMKRDSPYRFGHAVTKPCDTCERLVVYETSGRDYYRRHVFCCERCGARFYNGLRNRHNAEAREKVCEVCEEAFTATRRDAKTCSPACKQKAYRRRRAS